MLVSQRIFYPWFACAILFCAASASGQSETPKAEASQKPEDEIRKLADSLTKAFNSHDADAMASHWLEDGVHASTTTGTKLVGRPALTAAYRKLFTADPESEIALGVTSVRQLTPDILSVDCTSALRHSDGSVTRSQLNAILVRRDGEWRIAQVQESDVLDPSAVPNPLHELDWLIGRWGDESPEALVVNEFKWTHNGRFLKREFQLIRDDEVVRGGTQFYGWDPTQQTIRCWLFLDDGGFGEGTCTSDGDDKWVVKLAVTLADGRSGSLKQIVQRNDEDSFTVQTIDREIDGEAQPNGEPVTLERLPEDGPALIETSGVGAGDE